MGKELKLPPTDAETAEKRLEELVTHKTVEFYHILHNDSNIWVEYLDCRLYPDGFETISRSNTTRGVLHIDRRKILVFYSLDKEIERLSD
ncbi:MAG: hypothetical protein Q8O03_02150 [Nanoarchaeota archaeon]|nr:hypothetical protein [Nanoarchaeota archaeon]